MCKTVKHRNSRVSTCMLAVSLLSVDVVGSNFSMALPRPTVLAGPRNSFTLRSPAILETKVFTRVFRFRTILQRRKFFAFAIGEVIDHDGESTPNDSDK